VRFLVLLDGASSRGIEPGRGVHSGNVGPKGQRRFTKRIERGEKCTQELKSKEVGYKYWERKGQFKWKKEIATLLERS